MRLTLCGHFFIGHFLVSNSQISPFPFDLVSEEVCGKNVYLSSHF